MPVVFDDENIMLGIALRVTAATLAASLSLAAWTQTIYKCKDESGTTVFSEQPCGRNAVKTDVRPSRGAAPAPSSLAPTAPDSTMATAAPRLSEGEKLKREADQAGVSRRLREIDFEIDAAERRISVNKTRIEDLRYQKRFTYNNLAGATLESSLSQEMEAVARLIQEDGNKIRALQAERTTLANTR